MRAPFGLLVPAVLLLGSCVGYTEMTKDPAAISMYQGDAQADVFIVKGCVRHPGRFHVKTGERITLSGAIQRAGGTISGDYFAGEPAASLNGIRVLRMIDGRVVAFKLSLFPGKSGCGFPIKPGDEIYVPEVFF